MLDELIKERNGFRTKAPICIVSIANGERFLAQRIRYGFRGSTVVLIDVVSVRIFLC